MRAALKASETRILPKMFNEVVYKGERIRIEHRSAGAAYLVSEDDYRLLEELEHRLYAKLAQEALDRHEATGGKTISLEDMEARLGL